MRRREKAVSSSPLIALLTDFGTRDWFVSAMKGAIFALAPSSRIVDISHDIDPGDIHAAAFALMAASASFEPHTVFCVVVDPGVGSSRRAIAAKAGDYSFIGPDNGVLSFALRSLLPCRIHSIENDDLFRKPVSATFHGRDIFAPTAAHLANGVSIETCGPVCTDAIELSWPEAKRDSRGVQARVVYIDRFGNAFTSITAETVADCGPEALIQAGAHTIPLKRYYQQEPDGALLAVVNSSGYLEIAVNGGSAAQALGLAIGSPVVLIEGQKH